VSGGMASQSARGMYATPACQNCRLTAGRVWEFREHYSAIADSYFEKILKAFLAP
jgi:hypothetical protein